MPQSDANFGIGTLGRPARAAARDNRRGRPWRISPPLADIHTAQLLSYLRVTGIPLGLLIDFNVNVLKDGVRRVALSPDLI